MASPGGEKIKSTKGVKKNNEGTTEKLLGLKEKDIKAGGQQIIVPKAKTTARKIESNEAAEKKVEQPKAKVETRTVEERPVQKAASRTVEEKPVQKTAPKAVEEKVSTKQVEPKASKKVEEIEEQPVKRGRGRPKKVVTEEAKEETSKAEKNEENQPVKRGRGRPKKVVEEDKEEEEVPARKGKRNLPEEDDEENILPGFGEDSEEEEEENILPGFGESSEEEEEENVLPGFEEDSEEDEEENVLPGFGEDSEEDEEENTLPGFEEDDESEQYDEQEQYNEESARNSILSKAGQEETEGEDLSSLLTESKKIVTFVGSPKNGTSFIVNNLAELLSSMGINTAILDMTRSKNSYYIYTRNEEELRKIAFTCMNNLKNGRANGIQANKNLTIYTSLPTEDDYNSEITILETLVRKHDLILIDCDYETPLEYFRQSQEIYLVQSMDILTIQPLTAFLKTLKERNILNERKLKIIINKYLKLKTISEKIIVGGMSSYNDPAMSFMTNLFDRSRVSYITIPFDEEIYVNYLDGVVNCDISLKNYLKSSKKFMQNLKQLGNMVYPYDKRGASGMRR